jgi:hypothetical protein
VPAIGATSLFLTTSGGTVLNLGTAIDASFAWIQTKALNFDQIRQPKFLESLIYNISNRTTQTNLVIQVYGSDEEEENFTLLDTIDVDEGSVAYTDPPGYKYFKFRIYDEVIVERWRLSNLEVWGEFGGDEF